jgi:hypothetical protein
MENIRLYNVRLPFDGSNAVAVDPLCVKVCQWLAAGRWFSPGTPVSSTNITDRHNITEILLKAALNLSLSHVYFRRT